MKIVMDFRKYDGVVGGVERGVIEIARHLASLGHQLVILPKRSRLAEVEQELGGLPGLRFVPLDVDSHVMSVSNVRLDAGRIQAIGRQERADLVHFPYNWSFPLRKAVPCLLTVHDVIPLTFREAMGPLRNRLLYRPAMRLACRLNDVIATVSNFSKGDISRRLNVPEEKIRVIPNGIRDPYPSRPDLEAALEQRFGLEHGFVLYVGGIHERKNVPGLIDAFAAFARQATYPGKLVVTGRVAGAPYQEHMKRVCDSAVRKAGLDGKVIFTGFVTDEELDTLMRRAIFLVYPSFYEGFGIPVLEAMRAGIPVITSSTTALPEVAGDAALLVDPADSEQIVAEMLRLLRTPSLRNELIEKGKRRAEGYTWEKTSLAYLALYQEVCG